MKKFTYEGYTKEVNGKNLYIIKKFEVFSEDSKIPPHMVAMGMHHNFDRAARLANLDNKSAYLDLKDKLGVETEADKINLYNHKPVEHKPSVRFPFNWFPKFRWVNL